MWYSSRWFSVYAGFIFLQFLYKIVLLIDFERERETETETERERGREIERP